MSLPLIDQVTAAIAKLADALQPVGAESVTIEACAGRVLAQTLSADRDHPSLDVSAMDGYAVRIEDLNGEPLEITGEIAAGSPPLDLFPKQAIRIFTGGPVPTQANVVVRREDADASHGRVIIRINPAELRRGQNIRRRGENVKQHQALLESGTLLSAAPMSAVATFGSPRLSVYTKVRVAILNTGDELVPPGQSAKPWQIRDSNGPVLEKLLRQESWIDVVQRRSVGDQLATLVAVLRDQLKSSDAILLTGGVSMGDYDFVPEAIQQCGGTIHFHRLPIRPGRPILGAVGPDGQTLMGLPGNPVSVAITAKKFAMSLLRKRGGFVREPRTPFSVYLSNPDAKTLDLVWYRLVRLLDDGRAELLDARGSGDLVSLAISDGFIEVPPGLSGPGPWKYYAW